MTMRVLALLGWIAVPSACSMGCAVVDGGSAARVFEPAAVDATRTGGILLTSAADLGRPCETLAIVDLHSDAGDEATGFDELRAWATRMGADAVVAARYEAATASETAHVFGIVVRFKSTDARPYDVVASVEVRSETAAPDKGLEALRTKARELGADKVVDVRFEHSEGGVSRLRGVAVRYRR